MALAILLGNGCGQSTNATMQASPVANDRYSILCTTGMIADIARNLAAERADITQLMPAGVDPHLYQPTRSDVVKLSEADVILYNGLHLEGKMGDLLDKMRKQGKVVIAVCENLDGYELIDGDPHLWGDVKAWILVTKRLAQELSKFDPDYDFASKVEAYVNSLGDLDTYAREAIATIPEDNAALITAHDAFAYFGRAYGIEVRGIQGITTESEAGLRDIEQVIDFIVERGIPAVFVESSVADKNVRALVEGARARGHQLEIGAALFSDATGPAGTYEGTYIGMIDHNVTYIVKALGGTAPARGMLANLSLKD